MQVTTLGRLSSGGRVNIEVDIIGKYVEKMLSAKNEQGSSDASSGMNASFLAENGFW